jgi:hypothetical protein
MKTFICFLLFGTFTVCAQETTTKVSERRNPDVRWHKFSVSGSGQYAFTVGRVSVSIATREVPDAAFREDHLVMTVRLPGQKAREYWFASSYGLGEVAVQADVLLLKYGVGRGTSARVEHVRALRLHSLDELVDVQSSYYVLSDIQNATPELVEYRLKIQTERDYTTLSYSLPKPQRGLPSEKIVRLKNDG